MMKKLLLLAFSVSLLTYGCIKETYDLDKVSEKAQFSPSVFVPVFKGTAAFGDFVRENDTVVFGDDKFVRLIFREDSVIDIDLDDLYDLNDLVDYNEYYQLGELEIDPFTGSFGLTLSQITQNFSTSLRDQFALLDDGSPHPFPQFPETPLGIQPFPDFSNFEEAVFSSGYIDIELVNNLPAPLGSVEITLSDEMGQVGTPLVIDEILSGQTGSQSIDLSGLTLTNSLSASIVLSGSPGNPDPVLISLENSGITVSITGRDLKISSGKVILPEQTISSGMNTDTITFTPSQEMELESMAILTGIMKWTLSTNMSLYASVDLTLPTVKRNGIPLSDIISIESQGFGDGEFDLTNTVVEMNSDLEHPYNKLPYTYSIKVSSDNNIIEFNSADMVQFGLNLSNPEFDYIKGYFGQETESLESETLDLGIEDILGNITGDFRLSDPSITLDYENSFGLPIEIVLDINGIKNSESINLGLDPINIDHPDDLVERDISSSFVVDKDNSTLPDFVSLPPEEVVISGSAKMNPAGDELHLRDNYIYGTSRFLGSVEIEVPLELSIDNLHLCDTTENFISDEDFGFDPGDVKMLTLDIHAENGFPFGVSFSLSLYDSESQAVLATMEAPGFLEAAPVDSYGKVNGIAESEKRIEFTDDFLDKVNDADQIIFDFEVSTTNSQNVRIYSDYKIDFDVVLGINPVIDLDL